MRSRASSVEADWIAALAQFYIKNLPFEKRDELAKLKICEIPDKTMCCICGQSRRKNGKGDHFYERKGYFRITGCYGINDTGWNCLPVCSRPGCNSGDSYKVIILTNGVKRDIGWYNLTDAEILLVPPYFKTVVRICRNWKAYLQKRGVTNYFKPTERDLEKMAEQKMKYINMCDKEEEDINQYLSQKN